MTDSQYLSEIFDYLDKLRESGITNMFGAGEFLHHQFDMDTREAREYLSLWMNTFDPDKSITERVEEHMKNVSTAD